MRTKGAIMKRRIIISIVMFGLIFITLPFVMTLLDLEVKVIYLISSIVALVYVGFFIFGGVPELIVNGIYGLITAISLSLATPDYHLPIIIIATLIIILNPLAQFESYLRSKMKSENTEPIQISFRGKRWPFFAYRKEMKNFYHLPQSRKFFTIKSYKAARQISTIIVLGFGIFLFINEINHIANSLDNFSWSNFLTFYIIIIIFLLAYFIHIKGFTSTFRTFGFSLIPPVIYLVIITDFDYWIRFSVVVGISVVSLVVAIIELIKFHQRVVYDALVYTDYDTHKEVHANALFEPLVYNETYTLCTIYTIKTDEKTFDKHFKDLLVYANFYHFIIVAYTIEENEIQLYAHFYYKSNKRTEKFKIYLESLFKKSIHLHAFSDYNKSHYEKEFFHKDAYIIARAQHLAKLLKELHIRSKIIISMIVYFENDIHLEAFNTKFNAIKLNEITIDHYVSAKIDVLCINNPYVIEKTLKKILLHLFINNGKFVRLNVYY